MPRLRLPRAFMDSLNRRFALLARGILKAPAVLPMAFRGLRRGSEGAPKDVEEPNFELILLWSVWVRAGSLPKGL